MATSKRWMFTKEQVSKHTPSRKNYTEESETNYRQSCARIIQQVGQYLNITVLGISTACVYMHRFYMYQSLAKFHYKKMAAACLFLAAKVEEQPRKIEHVIQYTHTHVNRREDGSLAPKLDVKSQEYLEQVQQLIINENILLQVLGFNIKVEHSNASVLKCLNVMNVSKDLMEASFLLSTNSLLGTSMCLTYTPNALAAACIHVAAKYIDYKLDKSKEGKDWWNYLVPNLTEVQLLSITKELLEKLEKAEPIIKWKKKFAEIGAVARGSPYSGFNSPANSPAHPPPHRPSHLDPSRLSRQLTPQPSHKPSSSHPSGSHGPPSHPSGSHGPPSHPSSSHGPPSHTSGSHTAPLHSDRRHDPRHSDGRHATAPHADARLIDPSRRHLDPSRHVDPTRHSAPTRDSTRQLERPVERQPERPADRLNERPAMTYTEHKGRYKTQPQSGAPAPDYRSKPADPPVPVDRKRSHQSDWNKRPTQGSSEVPKRPVTDPYNQPRHYRHPPTHETHSPAKRTKLHNNGSHPGLSPQPPLPPLQTQPQRPPPPP